MTYCVPLRLAGCKLPSGVAFAELSDAIELTDDNEDSTSETGATPKDDSISSKSLYFERSKKPTQINTQNQSTNSKRRNNYMTLQKTETTTTTYRRESFSGPVASLFVASSMSLTSFSRRRRSFSSRMAASLAFFRSNSNLRSIAFFDCADAVVKRFKFY